MRRYPDRGLHGRVVDALGTRIVGGDIAAGETLDGDALASEYDVSRTVVRETLKVLAGKGLIDARPRRGTQVTDRSEWNLLDPDVLRWQFTIPGPGLFERLHELRLMVEPSAAELAASRRTPADLEGLREAVRRMGAPGATPDEIAEADLEFHLGLIAATHNDLIEQLSTTVGIGLAARDRHVHANSIPISRGLDAHELVLDAVLRQDAPAARSLMTALLTAAAADLRGLTGD